VNKIANPGIPYNNAIRLRNLWRFTLSSRKKYILQVPQPSNMGINGNNNPKYAGT
jgi:hypothetical protein